MADTDSSSVPKPQVDDLLNRLNASFARVHRNMTALERVGIFDYHLLGTLRGIEERDREKFSQPPNE